MPTVISELTGEPLDASSEAFRHECECRWLLTNKPTKLDKHLYLYGVEDRSHLLARNQRTGDMELAENWRSLMTQPKSIASVRGIAAADRILEDAKRLYQARQRKSEDTA